MNSGNALNEFRRKAIIAMQVGAVSTPLVTSALYVLSQWIKPCTPATSLYFMISTCRNGDTSLASNIILLISSLTSGWILFDTCSAYLFQVYQLAFLQCLFMVHYLRSLTQSIKANCRSWQVKSQRFFQSYLELQIICQFTNLVHQDATFVSFACFAGYCYIISMYVLIYYGLTIPIAQFILFVDGVLNGILGIVCCYGVFGEVSQSSQLLLDVIRIRLVANLHFDIKKDQKRALRQVRCLRPLRIKLGSVNFVDKATMFVLLDFCTCQVVTILLIK